jgi:hypothetical protein
VFVGIFYWFRGCHGLLANSHIVAKVREGKLKMLETIAVLLILFWLLGFVSAYTLGGFIHLLLVLAVVVIVIRVIQGRRVL